VTPISLVEIRSFNQASKQQETEIKQSSACLIGIHIYTEDGASMFLRNIFKLLRDYTASLLEDISLCSQSLRSSNLLHKNPLYD
jgi:hypothetical protein